MPLPKLPFSISGGCNCQAVRYEISVPAFEDRALNCYCTPGKERDDLRLPTVLACQCNDCRAATGSILPGFLVAESSTVQASSLPRSGAEQREWVDSFKLFDPNNQSLEQTYLSVYNSSPGRFRWFCSRCGTPLAYSVDASLIPKEWKWPKMLDIVLGTVDRKDLKHEYMRPERAVWCHFSIPWIRDMLTAGLKELTLHPLTKIDKVMGEDVEDDLKMLRELKSRT
ncbi:uncharacterized protein AB675_7112 [Cyphellophora attinorum]|uniref:Uncharacterized protein n=1 Tax=Cyphellophora attinorum TaxID=1664694 RepID=A0A0N0NQ59_9EURO|nr:uncharacterized protein AB675_7112 [Phialophora attinorum]KPI43528.1 hypothetical protein AB675_7112 [Phialophora attinorum]